MGRPKIVRARLGYDYEMIEVPRQFFELACRRTREMLKYQLDRRTLADVVANAYLQGLEDGFYVSEHQHAPRS